MSTEKKAALEGILIMLMHSGHITISVDAGEIEATYDNIAESNITDTLAPFCDMKGITENALDSLSGNNDVMQVMMDSGENRDVKKAEIMIAIDEFVESCLWEVFIYDTFTKDELQAIFKMHPDYKELKEQDDIDNQQDDEFKQGRAG